MKHAILFLFLVVFSGFSSVAAQQKNPVAVDTVKAARDSIAKNDVAVKKVTTVKTDTVSALKCGRLTVTTTPETAEVSIDSVVKGSSPLTLDSIAAGNHVLIVKRKGYFGKKVLVEVKPDSMLAVEVTLVKPGSLVLKSNPSGANVFLDGREAGVTPYENAKLKPGNHSVRIEKYQFGTVETTITASEGTKDSLSFTLQPMPVAPAAAAPPPKVPAQKRGLDTTILIVLTSIFVVFGIVIFGIESGSN
jgi:hypothetical protein